MAHRKTATFHETSVSDAATASSPLSFPSGAVAPPPSTRRGVAPSITGVKKRHPLPAAVCGVAPPEDDRVSTLSFDMSDVTPPVANMLRRVIMTEVPTMAFDRVLVYENDGVVLDELLSHRLGMCPVAADAAQFEYITMSDNIDFSNPSARHVLRFDLDITAPTAADAPPITNVYSRDLVYRPMDGQPADVALVHGDILLAKLGRGQRIRLEAYAIKGLGLTHAKWQPVSACWYDMVTSVTLSKRVSGAAATRLKSVCPMGVFDIEDGAAVVKKASKCTLCRECLRDDNTDLGVVVQKDKTQVKFTLESLGQYAHPEDIVRAALAGFADRCRNLKSLVEGAESMDPK